MMIFIVDFLMALMGLAVIPILFFQFPALPSNITGSKKKLMSVSIIIPARNEEKNLPLLLDDLRRQTLAPHEIICVDDGSEDQTARIAQGFGVRLISLTDKPDGWTGKNWACYHGSKAATGSLLLFLDADVRLGPEAIQLLLHAYCDEGCTISVQPYHQTERLYEQFSLMFNLVQVAANGTQLPHPTTIGLHGPVILIAQTDYQRIGGHESVKSSIVDDIALGERLKAAGMRYRLFIGDKNIAYRMYGDGIRSLFQGWVKNIAVGASKTSIPILVMVILWISSLISVPLHIIQLAVGGNTGWLIGYLLLYSIWTLLLRRIAQKIGRFQWWATVFFPIVVAFFLVVFVLSLLKQGLGIGVLWKGRSVEGKETSCK